MSKISFNDFQKLDLRVGTVVKAEVPKWSHWVMKLTVDFGKEIGEKTAFAGIMKYYKPTELEGNQYPFIVNLEPKNIGPKKELSECMMLMIVPKEDEETSPILFSIRGKVANGTKVR